MFDTILSALHVSTHLSLTMPMRYILLLAPLHSWGN